MSSIDERIVKMEFDNAQFERGVKETLRSLDDLKSGLKFDGGKRGLAELADISKSFSLSNIAASVDNISSKFSALGAIGFSALQKITHAAMDTGAQMLGALVNPLVEGGKKRALNIEQAKFQFKGLKMDVEQAMDDALYAVQGTAYGLDEAAVAASQFGASGVQLGEDMKNALRGISGVAAMAGAGYSDIANVFTKVAGQGRLMGDDLNRLGTRGINAAATLAEHFNNVGKTMNATEFDIREMVTKGKISFQDFSEAMSAAFGEHATKASETYTGALSNMRAALARIGADVATPYFEMQRRIFVALTPVIDNVKTALEPVIDLLGTMMDSNADNIVSRLADVDLSGLTEGISIAVDAFKLILSAIKAFLIPVKQAFQQIFPADVNKTIVNVANALHQFALNLQVGASQVSKIRRIFAGFFAVFSIAGQVVKALFGVLKSLFGQIGEGTGGFTEFLAKIGDWLVSVDKAIKEGKKFTDFFDGLKSAILVPIDLIRVFVSRIKQLFGGGVDTSVLDASMDRLKGRFASIQESLRSISPLWNSFVDGLSRAKASAQPAIDRFKEIARQIGTAIVDGLKNFDFNTALDAINTGLFAGLVILIKKFFAGGIGNTTINFSGILDPLKKTFEGLTGYLKALQQNVNAKTLLTIASALGILALSAIALSMVDSKKLAAALGALTGMFAQLFASMAAFQKLNAGTGMAQFGVLAAGMVVLSTAVLILSSAVKSLASMSWEELTRGLTGITGILTLLAGASRVLQGAGPSLVAASVGLVAISVALRVLATAVKAFAVMEWEEMARGFAGVGAALTSLAIFTRLASVGAAGLAQTAGLLLLSVALRAIASAVRAFADMDWETLGRGFAALGGSLLIVAGATRVMQGSLGGIAAMIVVSGALSIFAKTLKNFSGLSWDEIARGLVALGGGLLIIAGALYLMTGTIAGAAALMVASAALALLAPALIALSGLSWSQLGMGLAALAAAFVVLGVGALALAAVVPILLGLGAAVALFGVGALAAGAGVLAFATGIAALAGIGAVGVAAITLLVSGIIALIPKALAALATGLVEFAKVIAQSAPVLAGALGAVLVSLVQQLDLAINELLPKLFSWVEMAVKGIVDLIVELVPYLVDGGLKMLTGILEGIRDNIGAVADTGAEAIVEFLKGIERNIEDVANAAGDVIVKFIESVGHNGNKIIDAGWDTIIAFIEGVTKSINDNIDDLIAAGQKLARAILEGIEKVIIASPGGRLWEIGKRIGEGISRAAENVLGIQSPSKRFKQIGKFVIEGFVLGLVGGRDAIRSTYQVMRTELKSFIDDTARDISQYKQHLERLNKDSKKNEKEIDKTKKALARARREQKKAQEALKELTSTYKENRSELMKLGKQYEQNSRSLEKNIEILKDAKKTRDDYRKSISDQYNELKSFTDSEDDNHLENWTTATKQQISDTKKFASALQTLRDRGLNDTLYAKLLEEGPEALPFVQQLVDAGDSGVRDINALADELERVSKKLGKTASNELYQAAVDSAQGIVDGLKKERKKIEKEMRSIAKAMAKALKKELGIKSPSRVFRDIAVQTMRGLLNGVQKSTSAVSSSTAKVGNKMSEALKASLSSVGDDISADMGLHPTITPVLDLSGVQKDSNLIEGLLTTQALKLDTTYAQATALLAEARSGSGLLGSPVSPAGTNVTVYQENYSPRALSPSELYRQTKNAVSVARKELPG